MRRWAHRMLSGTPRAAGLDVAVAVLTVTGVVPNIRAQKAAQPSKVQTLTPLDYIEIRQLVARYGYAVDTGADNGNMYADLFAPDGAFLDRTGKATTGRDALAAVARRFQRGPQSQFHFLMNHVIEATADGARGKEYLLQLRMGEPGPRERDLRRRTLRGYVPEDRQQAGASRRVSSFHPIFRPRAAAPGAARQRRPCASVRHAARCRGFRGRPHPRARSPRSTTCRSSSSRIGTAGRSTAARTTGSRTPTCTRRTASSRAPTRGRRAARIRAATSWPRSRAAACGDRCMSATTPPMSCRSRAWTAAPSATPTSRSSSWAPTESRPSSSTAGGTTTCTRRRRVAGDSSSGPTTTRSPGSPCSRLPHALAPIVAAISAKKQPAPAEKPASGGPSLSAEDYIGIQDLVARYPFALDADVDEGASYANLFTPDAVFRQPLTEGREKLATLAVAQPHGPQYARHFITNHVIDAAPGGGATGKEYLVVVDLDAPGKPGKVFLVGHYDDTYAKTAAGWRFKTRTFVTARPGTPGRRSSAAFRPRRRGLKPAATSGTAAPRSCGGRAT